MKEDDKSKDNDTIFIEKKLEQLNNQEKELLAQEEKLEKESEEILAKTKTFLQ
jgi:hypothetical protein